VPIYICPACGDLGCGAITARIGKRKKMFEWSYFAFENNYEGTVELYPHIGPFYFKKDEYNRILDGYGQVAG
jgi:hypothetical protein